MKLSQIQVKKVAKQKIKALKNLKKKNSLVLEIKIVIYGPEEIVAKTVILKVQNNNSTVLNCIKQGQKLCKY